MTDDREYQPDFGAGEASGPRRSYARKMAGKVTREFSLVGPPVDVGALIAARGLRLVLEEVPGALSGQLFPDQHEVFINTHARSPGRQRFTMAHEFGHWELKHYLEEELPPDSRGFEGVYDSASDREGHSPTEVEANTFAAELLMPGPWVRQERRPVAPGRAHQLADAYGVSREAMFYQLLHYKML